MSIETVRVVKIRVHSADFDRVFDALPEHYYDDRRVLRRWWEPLVSAEGCVISVSRVSPGPAFWHKRVAARVCQRALVGASHGWADITFERVTEVWSND